jgi:trigger factor
MNITRDKINELNSVITINITPEDYKANVEKALKDHSKKANMPGFRKGNVPVGHIKKLYGKSILVDEINNLLSDSLNNYISENKLEVLGQPLPKADDKTEYKWDFEEAYEFSYEVGLAPEFNVEFSDKDKFTKYIVKADEETIASRMKNLRRSYGKMTNPEKSEDGDVLYSELVQLSPDGSVFEGGITNTTSLRLDLVTDADVKKSLIGLKNGDVVELDIQKAYGNDAHRIGHVLNIDEETAKELKSKFQLTVKNVNRLEEADLNEELFTKLYADGSVKNADDFKAKVVEEIEQQMAYNADNKLKSDIQAYALEKFNFELPDAFLKRWIKATNEKVTEEEIEKDYPNFVKNLKWTLIENKLMQANNIELKSEDVVALAKERIAQQFAMYSPAPLTDEQLNEYTMQFLQNRESATRIYDELRSIKVLEYLTGVVNTTNKEIDYKAFLELK